MLIDSVKCIIENTQKHMVAKAATEKFRPTTAYLRQILQSSPSPMIYSDSSLPSPIITISKNYHLQSSPSSTIFKIINLDSFDLENEGETEN
jgi:hypothetical protein